MKLTENHIQELYKFTRQHYVYHFDVQTELVDHLANDIEAVLIAQPKLSFEAARDVSFKKFGIFGFMDVVEAKQKQMTKRYRKIFWRFLKEWFSLPKIITTLAIFLFLFLILKIPYSEYILITFLGSFVFYDAVKQYLSRRKNKVKEVKKEKIFLLEAMIGTTRNNHTGLAFIHFINLFQLVRFSFSSLENHWLLLISVSATLVFLSAYITSYVIPQKAEELLIETYPEYKLAKNM